MVDGSVSQAFIHDFHTGGRFSMKAPSPSFASSYPIFSLITPCIHHKAMSIPTRAHKASAHASVQQRHEPHFLVGGAGVCVGTLLTPAKAYALASSPWAICR